MTDPPHTEEQPVAAPLQEEPRPWSRETHCALCLRPFPTDAERERHEDGDCEEPCWCEAFCWVSDGGECIAEMEGVDPYDLIATLRSELRAKEAELASARGWGDELLAQLTEANARFYNAQCAVANLIAGAPLPPTNPPPT